MRGIPKSEGRNPKEIRRPKSEWENAIPAIGVSCVSGWGDQTDSGAMALREDGSYSKEPRQDLAERTARFGEAVIKFAKRIPQGPINNRLIDQLVGAATSIGANYCEADDSVSGKEFKQKIGFARKESKETMHFLRMVAASEDAMASEARALWREAKELNLIFGAIWRK
jgi:four helix bundle protein